MFWFSVKYLLSLKMDGEEDAASCTPSYSANNSAFASLFQEREKMQVSDSLL